MQVTTNLRARRDPVPPQVEKAAHAVEQLGSDMADALRMRSRIVSRQAKNIATRSRELHSRAHAAATEHPIAALAGCVAIGALVAAVFRRAH